MFPQFRLFCICTLLKTSDEHSLGKQIIYESDEIESEPTEIKTVNKTNHSYDNFIYLSSC